MKTTGKIHKITNMQIDDSIMGILKAISYPVVAFVSWYCSTLKITNELVSGLGILMVIDTASSLVKHLRIDKNKITSKAMKDGLFKKIVMLILPVVITIALKTVGVATTGIVTAYFSILILAEAYSAVSNLHCAYVREDKMEYDAFSALIKWSKDKLFAIMKGIMGNDKAE